MPFTEVIGDLFEYLKQEKNVDAICCTTNKVVKNNGDLVMGAGIAKEFAKRYPKIPTEFGKAISIMREKGYVCNTFPLAGYEPDIVYFATKDHWKDPSTPEIIEESLKQLVMLTNINAWSKVILPKPGCQNGGLDWTKDVKPLCEKYLNEKFVVISK